MSIKFDITDTFQKSRIHVTILIINLYPSCTDNSIKKISRVTSAGSLSSIYYKNDNNFKGLIIQMTYLLKKRKNFIVLHLLFASI